MPSRHVVEDAGQLLAIVAVVLGFLLAPGCGSGEGDGDIVLGLVLAGSGLACLCLRWALRLGGSVADCGGCGRCADCDEAVRP